jgi:hypothetical protein
MRNVIIIAAVAALILLAGDLVKGIVAPSWTGTTYNLHFGQKPNDCPGKVARVRESEGSLIC